MTGALREQCRLPPSIHVDAARPWMHALEMQFLALRFATNYVAEYPEDKSGADRGLLDGCYAAALCLPQSEAYVWSGDVARAVLLASQTIPLTSEVTSSLLPSSTCWWWFDEPIALAPNPALEGVPELDAKHIWALSVGSYENGDLLIVVYRRWIDVPVPTTAIRVKASSTLEYLAQGDTSVLRVDGSAKDENTVPRLVDTLRFIIAGCAWLKQRILVCSSGHIERHRRKQLARDYQTPPPTDVKVIELRRREVSHQPNSSAEDVAWSCRWIVNGHWRNQPYKHERKLIYIMPFVKGPADMPLKVPTHVVYQVNR